MDKKYHGHWFTKSLTFKKPSVKTVRQKKPLPQQRSLFDEPKTTAGAVQDKNKPPF